jgi:nitrite reductase/ring-hydroxylating ferredoxin subunit
MTMLTVRLCHQTELAEGESRGFDPFDSGQDTLLLVRHQGQLYAYRDVCPHYGDTPMAWRRHAYLDAARTHIVCAAHGALFNIADGVCIRGPCLGQALTLVPIALDAGGEVYACLTGGGYHNNE